MGTLALQLKTILTYRESSGTYVIVLRVPKYQRRNDRRPSLGVVGRGQSKYFQYCLYASGVKISLTAAGSVW